MKRTRDKAVAGFISIHAPVKGATGSSGKAYTMDDLISIHAPVKGATRCTPIATATGIWDFNPRTREGCDTDSSRFHSKRGDISIHAPVKGATIKKQ